MTFEEYVNVVMRRKWTIMICIFLSMIITAVVYIRAPKTYSAETVVFVFPKSSKLSGLGIATQMMSFIQSSGDINIDYVEVLLKSNRLMWNVFQELDLKNNEFFEMPEDAKPGNEQLYYISKLKKRVIVTLEKNTFEIMVEVRDPELASQIANEIVRQLNMLVMERGSSHKRFLLETMDANIEELTKREKEFTEFREKNPTVVMDEATGKLFVDALVQLETERAMSRIGLDEASILVGSDSGVQPMFKRERVRLEQRVFSLSDEIRKLEDELKEAPSKQMELLRIYRKFKKADEINRALAIEIESSKLDDESGKYLQVIDEAIPKMNPSGPSLKIHFALGLIYGVFLSMVVVFFKERMGRVSE